MLRLNCSKAHEKLRWRGAWSIDENLDATVAWYKYLHDRNAADMYAFSVQQIEEYTNSAREKKIAWTAETL
jgi:CDP-glucose 4,6-dehydratase